MIFTGRMSGALDVTKKVKGAESLTFLFGLVH
jgi:hypothetical protein